MEQALYGPEGYYSSGLARTGRAGDYFTAPETGAAFAHLLSTIFARWRARLAVDPFTLIEVGSGEGRLMQAICRGVAFDPASRRVSRSSS
jgi:SAM-dependent MidA family methyltransferase